MITAVLVGLILLLIFLAIGEDFERIFRRRAEGYRIKYGQYITRPVVVPAIVFMALGILMADALLTPFLFVVAGAIAYIRIKELIQSAGTITPRDVTQLVMAFRSSYQLQPAAFKSLEVAATKVGEPLSSMVTSVVNIFFNSSRTELAFQAFRQRTDNVLLHQFIYILEMSESASNESVTESLDAFVGRLQRQEELQRQVETGLASITGQTSFMQILAVLVAFVVAVVPGFKDVYTGGMLGRAGYIILILAMLLASYFIEKRVTRLKAQIL